MSVFVSFCRRQIIVNFDYCYFLCLCLFHDFREVIGNVNLTDANIDSTCCQYCAFRTSDHRPITKLLEALCFYAATFTCMQRRKNVGLTEDLVEL